MNKDKEEDTNIDDYLTTIDDPLDNITCGPAQFHCPDYKKINVYNQNIKIPLQKIWLKLPKVKIYKIPYVSTKKKQTGTLSVVLYDQDEEIKKIHDFLVKFQKRISIIIKKNYDKNISIKSCIKEIPNVCKVFNLKIPFEVDEDGDISYSIRITNKNKGPIILKEDKYISAFVGLSEIWMNATHFGFNWKILEMKIFPDLFEKSLFGNNQDQECPNCANCNKITLTPQLSYKALRELNAPPPPPPVPQKKEIRIFKPTINDILSIKLKPVTKIEKSNNTEQQLSKIGE
jgi:hypothetical protein